MGTIEISELLSYAVPLIIGYNVWLHNQIVKSQIDIAVNSNSDEAQQKVLEEIKDDMRAMREDIHSIATNK